MCKATESILRRWGTWGVWSVRGVRGACSGNCVTAGDCITQLAASWGSGIHPGRQQRRLLHEACVGDPGGLQALGPALVSVGV